MNKVLVAGDKIKPEMPLIQSGFIYSSCRPLTKI